MAINIFKCAINERGINFKVVKGPIYAYVNGFLQLVNHKSFKYRKMIIKVDIVFKEETKSQ